MPQHLERRKKKDGPDTPKRAGITDQPKETVADEAENGLAGISHRNEWPTDPEITAQNPTLD